MKKNKKPSFFACVNGLLSNLKGSVSGFASIISLVMTLSIATTLFCFVARKIESLNRIRVNYITEQSIDIVGKAIKNYAKTKGILPYPAQDKLGDEVEWPENEFDWKLNQEKYTAGYVPYNTLGIEAPIDGHGKLLRYYINPSLGGRKTSMVQHARQGDVNLKISNTTNVVYLAYGPNDSIMPEYYMYPPNIPGEGSKNTIIETLELNVLTNYLYVRSIDSENKDDLCTLNDDLKLSLYKNLREQRVAPITIPIETKHDFAKINLHQMQENQAREFIIPRNAIAWIVVSYNPKNIPSESNKIYLSKGDYARYGSRLNMSSIE